MNYTDRIFPTNKGLTTYLDELIAKNYQIPTFQRDIVWEQENVKKLYPDLENRFKTSKPQTNWWTPDN